MLWARCVEGGNLVEIAPLISFEEKRISIDLEDDDYTNAKARSSFEVKVVGKEVGFPVNLTVELIKYQAL